MSMQNARLVWFRNLANETGILCIVTFEEYSVLTKLSRLTVRLETANVAGPEPRSSSASAISKDEKTRRRAICQVQRRGK